MSKKGTKVAKQQKAKKEVTKRAAKKEKDPNAPKRACSSYIFYTQARRASLVKEQPNLNNKEVISALSKEWNGLSEADKAPYNKKAEADKARYTKEIAAYKK